MTYTGLTTFDNTLNKSHIWLGEVMKEMAWEDKRKAYAALRAVLHALRDRLSVDETANLGAQLPMLIRGMYYEGWRPAGKPLKYRHKEDFLQFVSKQLPGVERGDLEHSVKAVFQLLSHQVARGEIEEIRNQLPAGVRELWPPKTMEAAG